MLKKKKISVFLGRPMLGGDVRGGKEIGEGGGVTGCLLGRWRVGSRYLPL